MTDHGASLLAKALKLIALAIVAYGGPGSEEVFRELREEEAQR